MARLEVENKDEVSFNVLKDEITKLAATSSCFQCYICFTKSP